MGMADLEDSSAVLGTAVTCSTPTSMVLGPRGNGPLDNLRKGLDVSELTPSSTGKVRPYARRVASDGVPPRPLSERPLIKSSTRARPSLQTTHSSASTPNTHSVLPILRTNGSGKDVSHIRTSSSENNGHARQRRPPSGNSTVASSLENGDSGDEPSRNGTPSVRDMRGPQRKPEDSQTRGTDSLSLPKKNMCYFCQEDCHPGDNLCSRCQTRFQPQGEVFDYSESEYEDDMDFDDDDDAEFSSVTSQSPARSRRSSKRRTTRSSRPREKSRGWSEFSSISQLQQIASRSASTSPTPHVALQLKVVPPQEIKIRTVSSPIKANAGDGRSALHHIQQAMKPRASISPAGQDKESIRLGKVRSGEIRRVDIPDIIKAKPPTPNEKSSQKNSQGQPLQSRGSFENWLEYYGDGDKNSERHSGSARSSHTDLPTDSENSAVPATPGTYDRVTSIYDMYASFEDT